MISRFRTVTSTLVPSLLLLSANVWAADCAADADCDAGFACEKAQWVEGCAAPDMKDGPMECDTTVHEAETGTCVKQPVACESDADCGEYLSCAPGPSTGSCSASSDGTTTCDEQPEPQKFCAPVNTACEANSDCPRDFECVAREVGCAVPADCEGKDCMCDAATFKDCQPKKLECDADAACPTDWRCVNNTVTMCSGGSGSTGSSGGVAMGGGTSMPTPDEPDPSAPEPAMMAGASGVEPGRPGDETDPPVCTTEPSVGHCLPNAWAESFGPEVSIPVGDGETSGTGAEPPREDVPDKGTDGEGAPAGPTGTDEADDMDDTAEKPVSGGCTTSPSAPARTAWALMGLFLLAPLMRRRGAVARVRV
jgi:hypothetical protein